MPFAKLDGAAGYAVQQGRRPWIAGGPARREHGGARSRGPVQALAQRAHLGTARSREHDADRVQGDQLRMVPHVGRHLLERRLGDKPGELFDLLSHQALPARAIASAIRRCASPTSPQPRSFTHLPGSRSL
jgi:hypothetical protein